VESCKSKPSWLNMMVMMMMMMMRGIDYRGTTQSAKSGSDLAGLLGNGQGVCFGGYDVRQVSFKRYYSVSEEDDDEKEEEEALFS